MFFDYLNLVPTHDICYEIYCYPERGADVQFFLLRSMTGNPGAGNPDIISVRPDNS